MDPEFTFVSFQHSWHIRLTPDDLSCCKSILEALKEEPFDRLVFAFKNYFPPDYQPVQLLKAAASTCDYDAFETVWRLIMALYRQKHGRLYRIALEALSKTIVTFALALCTTSECSFAQKSIFTVLIMNNIFFPASDHNSVQSPLFQSVLF
jgi:hypothetical protein